MRYAHTVAQVRAAEEPLLAAGVPLMARASHGLAVAVATRLPFVYGARVALLVGSGNNGADALWAGAWLARRGAAVVAVLAGDPVQDALVALLQSGGRVGTAEALRGADLVVDGLVGIGGRGALRPAAAELVAQLEGFVVAVDVPSGVDADTGAIVGAAVRADLTVTFGTLKPGLLFARDHVGDLELVPVGLDLPPAPVEVLTAADVAGLLPAAERILDKYSRGVLGVAAGSQTYTGAAVLSVGAAVRAGAGMVRFVGAAHAAEQVRSRWPEAVVTEAEGAGVVDAGRVQAWVVGPGLGTFADETVKCVLEQDVPVLVDADALTICAQRKSWLTARTAPTLLTPHDREFARFGHVVGPDRIAAARRLAGELGVHVLLKGDATVVVGPDGPARVNTTGSPVLATAGSGDVLSGGIGALLAQGMGVLDAGSVGAYLHGRSGTLTADGATTSASLLVEGWPAAVREVRAGE
ncbi:MAG: carbohydrate kinase, YjeF related protein [Frankiales bacterium]|nr:carbohydrate kinase, YjeF related protein [Frankiales bacterium]